MDKPNILLLTIDTLRADMLRRSPTLTPQLDQFAQRSFYFTQAITGGSWTQAAFPVLLTSTYASMYGGCLGALGAERPSPISALAAAGYRTAAFSTSPLLSRTYGYDRGFQHFADLQTGESDPALRQIRGGQWLLRQPLTHSLARLVGQKLAPGRLYQSAAELNEHLFAWFAKMETAATTSPLDKQPCDKLREQPFFVWAHYMDVHWPYHLDTMLQKPGDVAQVWRDLAHLYEVNFGNGTMTPAQRRHYIQLYEQAVQYTDQQVGRLLEYVAQSSWGANTIVVIVADHGEEFMERRHWGHVEINLYDEIIKVPLIIHVPGGPTGRQISRQVRLLDVMPTLLALGQCPRPDHMLGESLVPLWNGRETDYQSTIAISERWREDSHIVAVRTEEFKYIWDSRQPDQPALYDLQVDPGEKRNVSTEYPAITKRLHAHVAERVAQMEATRPAAAGAEPVLDEEFLDRLRGLGYVE